MLWKSGRTLELVSHHLPPPNKENCRNNASPEAWCEGQWENCLRVGNSFRTSLAHWPVRLHQKTEHGSAQGTTGNALTFRKRHSLKSQWKRKDAHPASTHSNWHRLTWFSSVGGQCYSQRPAHNWHCFFLYLNCQKESTSLNVTRHDIYRNRMNPPPLKSLPQPTRTWHCTCREPICKCCHGWWRTSLTLQMYNWLIMDGNLMNMSTQCLPFLGNQLHHRNSWTSSVAAAKRRAKSVVEGVAMDPMECTSYCVCEGGMLAVTHLLNRRRRKATHNRVKWILMNLRGREWLIELMTVDTTPVIWHTVLTIWCLLNYCHMLVC